MHSVQRLGECQFGRQCMSTSIRTIAQRSAGQESKKYGLSAVYLGARVFRQQLHVRNMNLRDNVQAKNTEENPSNSARQQGQRPLLSHVLRAHSTQRGKWRQGLQTTLRLRSKHTTQGKLLPLLPAPAAGVMGSSSDGSNASISSSSSSPSNPCSSWKMFRCTCRLAHTHPATAPTQAMAHVTESARSSTLGLQCSAKICDRDWVYLEAG